MSGGEFDYVQFQLREVPESIDKFIKDGGVKYTNFDESITLERYSEETLSKFRLAKLLVEMAEEAIQRVDWLVSGDDGEDSFNARWDKEMARIAPDSVMRALNDSEKI